MFKYLALNQIPTYLSAMLVSTYIIHLRIRKLKPIIFDMFNQLINDTLLTKYTMLNISCDVCGPMNIKPYTKHTTKHIHVNCTEHVNKKKFNVYLLYEMMRQRKILAKEV